MITAVRKKEMLLLELDELAQLAANCPQCFGQPAPDAETDQGEPNFIVCCDGNFQQRRHTAASVPIPGFLPPTPELFMEPDRVMAMAAIVRGVRRGNDDEYVVRSITFRIVVWH